MLWFHYKIVCLKMIWLRACASIHLLRTWEQIAAVSISALILALIDMKSLTKWKSKVIWGERDTWYVCSSLTGEGLHDVCKKLRIHFFPLKVTKITRCKQLFISVSLFTHLTFDESNFLKNAWFGNPRQFCCCVIFYTSPLKSRIRDFKNYCSPHGHRKPVLQL